MGFALLPVPQTFPWSKLLMSARAVGVVVRPSVGCPCRFGPFGASTPTTESTGLISEVDLAARDGLTVPNSLEAADVPLMASTSVPRFGFPSQTVCKTTAVPEVSHKMYAISCQPNPGHQDRA